MLTHKPIGFEGTIRWEDSPDTYNEYYISFSEELLNHEGEPAEQDLYGVFDEFIFFYADSEQVQTLQKAIADRRGYVTLEPHSGWLIDLTEPYEFIYELAYEGDTAHMAINNTEYDQLNKVD